MAYWNQKKHLVPEVAMRKNISVEFTNERIIPSGGLAVVGAILGKSDFVKRCNRMKVDCNHPQRQIKNGDIMLTYIGMQCMGKPSFDAVREMDDDPDFYKDALGVCHAIPSAETLRQRLDLVGSSLRRRIFCCFITLSVIVMKQSADCTGIAEVR